MNGVRSTPIGDPYRAVARSAVTSEPREFARARQHTDESPDLRPASGRTRRR